MGLLSSINNSVRGAASQTVAIAEDARTLGFTNVQTAYEPGTEQHTVTGEPPAVPDTPKSSRFRR
jgi:hypothetical protein